MPSSPAHEGQIVSPSHEDALLVLYMHETNPRGYSLYSLDLDFFRPSIDDDDDEVKLPRHFPDPILSFGEDGQLPYGMGSFIAGSRLYMIGGCSCGESKETYYIDMDAIYASDKDDKPPVQRGPDMEIGRAAPLIIPVGELFYVISPNLSYSSCFEVFDPSTGLWTLLTAELDLPEYSGTYVITSYMVEDSSSIYLSTLSGIFVFNTDTRTWTALEAAKYNAEFGFIHGCIESSQYYVGCSPYPGKLLMYPKHDAGIFSNPIIGNLDPLGPYKKHLRFHSNQFLSRASRGDMFCYVCEGYDLIPFLYGNPRREKKHILVYTFDLLQETAPADMDSLRSPHYRHRGFSRDLYVVGKTGWDDGRIRNVFLISYDILGHNASRRP